MLTAAARVLLREKFLQADMGITGANFAVAETGTVVLVTNEGNGRMVTTLPRIHVAVMGIEKVIPSMTDLMVFLALLARSATGQKLSSYTTLVRGPRQAGELEGPDEFHLILMDSGRARQIAGPLREALYCLRCGACLNVCPVYRQIGGHAYGHTYPGPIGILLTAMLKGDRSVKDLAHASTLCGACKDVCPVRIDIPRMLVELRESLDREKIAPASERLVFKAFRRLLMSADGVHAVGAGSGAWRRSRSCGTGGCGACRSSSGNGRPRATCRPSPRGPSASAGRIWRDGHARGLPRPDPGGGRQDAGPLRGADRDRARRDRMRPRRPCGGRWPSAGRRPSSAFARSSSGWPGCSTG